MEMEEEVQEMSEMEMREDDDENPLE